LGRYTSSPFRVEMYLLVIYLIFNVSHTYTEQNYTKELRYTLHMYNRVSLGQLSKSLLVGIMFPIV